MTIVDKLKTYETGVMVLSTAEIAMFNKALSGMVSLAAFLQSLVRANQVVPLLYYERSGRNRPSFVARIYGRYKVLNNAEDKQELISGQKRSGN